MNIRLSFSFLTLLFFLISCQKSNRIVFGQELLKNDWISSDNKFMFIEDSLLCTNFLRLGGPYCKYRLAFDTLTLEPVPDSKCRNPNDFTYKIIELDSLKLKIKGITVNDSIEFKKLDLFKTNNLSIKRIDFSSGSCLGPCPILDLKITEDSMLYQFGYWNTKHKGLYEHKLSKSEFHRIQTKVNSLFLDSIKLSPMCTDAPKLSFFMKYDNDSLNISGMTDANVNFRLCLLLYYIESLDNFVKMSKSDKMVRFRYDFNNEWNKMVEKIQNAR